MTVEESEFKPMNQTYLKETTELQSEKRKLLDEISQLETKILEVNQVLYRHSIAPAIRLQLKEDLDYHQQQLEQKRQQLQQLHEAK